jgi:7,8-dihydropterin-6-yl-methyl-4-(beta-D-ribofuranosyl)aminobenzene 5'-phosphate synthase
VGYSDLYLKNAEKMNINLDNLNFIVISHGHDDHTGGLQFYPDKTERNKKTVLLSHPDALKEKKLGELAIGSPLDLSELTNLLIVLRANSVSIERDGPFSVKFRAS